MSEFKAFGQAVTHAYNSILKKDDGEKKNVFLVEFPVERDDEGNALEGRSTGDQLWDHYLASFPKGTNPMFRERTEHDCSTCRNFVRNLGAVVYVTEKEIRSVWDVKVDNPTYQAVADAMSKLVKSLPISQPFTVEMPSYGQARTVDKAKNESWHHFHGDVPLIFQWHKNDSNYVGEARNDVNGLRRSICEISDEAVDIVLDLIDQDSLYKGAEKRPKVELLVKLKKQYNKLKTDRQREIFLWMNATPYTRIYKDVVGVLMQEITEGVELEEAVKHFEHMTAGPNYKRSRALVTQKMIDDAKKTVVKLDLEDSLPRRYAVREDISVNDVLFVDGSVKPKLLGSAFDDIKPTKKAAAPKFDKVEDISIDDFIKKVLPKADSVEAFVKTRHLPQMVSLLAPIHRDATPLFKWDNGFSWSYVGDMADSDIRREVQAKGGRVDGVLRFSHSWNYGKRNASLMDLHVFMPGCTHQSGQHDGYGSGGQRVGWNQRNDRISGGVQDVDYVDAAPEGYVPVENITFPDLSKLKDGKYECKIHNWNLRQPTQGGFKAEIEFEGQIFEYEVDRPLKQKEWVDVATVTLKNGKFSIEHHLPCGEASKNQWGIDSENWVPVDLITRSPNFWNDQKVGHEHVFFMLKGCANEGSTRGFYNEYLRDDLHKHRKVFEVVAGQMRAQPSEQQLSGLGFSVGQRHEMQVRVKGSMNRVLNIKF